jgi:hypothetical protein
LVQLSLNLPRVQARQSRVAAPDSIALVVDDAVAAGAAEAFIDGHEFCHLHPHPEGSVHLILPPSMVEAVVALGWAERHPAHKLGIMATLVMVYAPRDECELNVVLTLIECARQFAMGASAGLAIARSVA